MTSETLNKNSARFGNTDKDIDNNGSKDQESNKKRKKNSMKILLDKVTSSLEQSNCIPEHKFLTVHRIKDKIISNWREKKSFINEKL